MTIADRQHAATIRRMALPAGEPVAITLTRWLVVSWDVAGDAIRGTLEWRIRDTAPDDAAAIIAAAIWRPHDGPPRTLASLTAAPDDAAAIERSTDSRGLEHFDIPGLLTLTFRRAPGGDSARVLYARTPLLATLGVRGGRVDHPVGQMVLETTERAHDGPNAPAIRPKA